MTSPTSSQLSEARDTLTKLDRSGDKVLLGYTVVVDGKETSHRDSHPTTVYEANIALDTLEHIGAEFQSLTVYRHGEM